jgi:MSHA pilin protein MshC
MLIRRAQGFTLVELVSILLLVAILSVVAIDQWQGSGVNLSAQADQLVNDLRYTQSLAMNRGQRYRINFAADHYWITDAGGTVTYTFPINGASQVTLNSGITLSTTNSFLVFDGNGVPYTTTTSPGTPLSSNAVITLSDDGETNTLTISPQTGRVIKS